MTKIDNRYSKYVFNIFFLLVGVVSLFVIKSYLIPLVGAVILSYIFYPLYKKMKGAVRNKNIASLITVLIVVLIIIIPLLFAANALFNESLQFFRTVRELDVNKIDSITGIISEDVEIHKYISDIVTKLSLNVAKGASEFIVTLPKRILSLFVMLFTMFYLLKEGKEWSKKLSTYIPLKESHRTDIGKRMNSVLYATLYGIVVIAFVQGILGAIGLWIFDVESPILWGLVMTIFAMLPLVGTYIIWLPAALFKIMAGDTFNGFGLILYGALIVSTVDNIIRPRIISGKGGIHPVLVLLGVFGGLEIFGLIGLILGPVILGVFTVFTEIYTVEKLQR